MAESDRISLRHYIETLMDEYRKAHSREHELLSEGVTHAREAIEIRLESMNEFRAQINSERGMMVSQDKCEARVQAMNTVMSGKLEGIEDRLGKMEIVVSNLKGKMSVIAASITIGLVILQLILTFVMKE